MQTFRLDRPPLRHARRALATAALVALLGLATAGLHAEPAAQPPVQPVLPQSLQASPTASAQNLATELVTSALGLLGVNYKWGGTSPETGLDCSGLVRHVFADAAGLILPRRAVEMSRAGEPVKRSELQPGDLVFFNTLRRAFSHVGIYIGEGRFVHAPSSGGEVRVEQLSGAYWSRRFNGGRRLIDAQDEAQVATAGLSPPGYVDTRSAAGGSARDSLEALRLRAAIALGLPRPGEVSRSSWSGAASVPSPGAASVPPPGQTSTSYSGASGASY